MFDLVKYYGWEEGGGGIGGGPPYDGGGITPDLGGGLPSDPPSGGTGGDPGGGGGSLGPSGGSADTALQAAVEYMNMEVYYYKINLESTKTNLYGEALEKWYYPPLQVKCIIERSEITNGDDEFGVTVSNDIVVKIPRASLEGYNFIPEVGDILMDREKMYEVSSLDQNFLTQPGGSTTTPPSGITVLYILKGYLTRTTKLNLIEYYQ